MNSVSNAASAIGDYIAIFWVILFALVLVIYLYLSPTVRAEFFTDRPEQPSDKSRSHTQ